MRRATERMACLVAVSSLTEAGPKRQHLAEQRCSSELVPKINRGGHCF